MTTNEYQPDGGMIQLDQHQLVGLMNTRFCEFQSHFSAMLDGFEKLGVMLRTLKQARKYLEPKEWDELAAQLAIPRDQWPMFTDYNGTLTLRHGSPKGRRAKGRRPKAAKAVN